MSLHMRMRLVLSFALLVAASSAAAAQSVDDIIARYVQHVGGADNLRAIQTLRRSGKFYGGGGFEAQVRNESKRPNKIREELTFGGMTGVNAFDGKARWKIEPWACK